MNELRGVANLVYHDALAACDAIKQYVVDPGTDPDILARAIRERPDQFGALRGKSGILGDNRERKEALHYARSVASLVKATARTWERQLERERNSETWKREKCDVVEVPALTPRSEDILTRLDALPYSEKPGYVKQMMNSAEGRKALEEAQDIDNALQTRFGTANLRNEHLARLRITADAHVSVERIKQVAGLVERAHRAALVEKQNLTLGQTQRLGLRI
ncbi:BID domain-containing protein [Agrobacterium sp. S2]|nr:BID domain-containing protein [Agrobacterium sp. S2]